ncbi:MAG: hypothetical protein ISR55_12015 [Bacteroidetes bacterium]|nr:hypothetical protein [Bacteroidota bacterium]
MKAATVSELKKELKTQNPKDLISHCIRLIKFRKENKELLTYLLFEADNEKDYIQGIKVEMDFLFEEINRSNLYYIKKSLRKILRYTNKFIKYSGLKRTEAELLIYYCHKVKDSGFQIQKSTALINLYFRQIQKIKKAISSLHEDLQYDFGKEMDKLAIQ